MSEHIYEDSDMENERYHVIPFGSMREEIVRCKDCMYRNPNPSEAIWEEDGKIVRGFPEKSAYLCSLINRCVDISGFCKWGIRREDEQIAARER